MFTYAKSSNTKCIKEWYTSVMRVMLYRVPLAGPLKISLKALVVMFQLKVFIKVNFEVLHLKM